MDVGPPENLVGHPIADPWESGLQEESGLDREATMPKEEGNHSIPIESR
jgi:hypothetical protein